MEITEIQIVPIKPSNGLVGFASCIVNNCLYLGSIGIYTRPQGGYRLTYPFKHVNNKQINYFHPITKEAGQQIEHEIVTHFEKVMKKNDRYSSSNS